MCVPSNGSKLLDLANQRLSQLIILVLFWSILWSIYGDQALPPGGHIFHLISLFILSCILAQICQLIYCPPLIGSLISGFIYRNVINQELNPEVSSKLRSTALVVILLQAGLELDPKVVRKLSFVCFRMAFVPLIVEVLAVTVAMYLLIDFPLKWGLLLGFVLSAASPALVVPGMLDLQQKGLGVEKGIPTLVMAAASIDDIMAITGFTICLGQLFTSGQSYVWTILKGPVEALVGFMAAIGVGIILWYVPKDPDAKVERILLILLSGLAAMFVSESLHFESFGTIATIVLSFVAALKWRSTGTDKPVVNTLETLWSVFDPLLYALIGIEVKISDLQSNEISYGLLALIIALVLRTLASMVAISGANLNLKEKIYASIAWTPKATVQAAIGSVALDMALQRQSDQHTIDMATLVLTLSVLSILITAPLGALWISTMGSRCLEKFVPKDNNEMS